MKQAEYAEGPQARMNFEQGMKVLFNVPKEKVVEAEKAKKRKKASRQSQLRLKLSDKE